MATKLEPDYPLPSTNNDSDGEEQEDSIEDPDPDQEEEDPPPQPSNVQTLLAKLQSSGALIKKPVKQEYRCFTCEEDYPDWETLENHLIQHVSLPSIVLDKLPSDDEYGPSGDEWSDEDQPSPPPKQELQKTPQKIEISQLLKNTGISIKKSGENTSSTNSESALSKLSGLGFTIKKNTTPIKEEKPDPPSTDDVMQKLGSLGGIKLKLKSDGNANSFKVVNGLKDFKTSDDEGQESGNEDDNKDDAKDSDDQEQEPSGDEQEDEKSPPVNNNACKQMTINSQANLRNKKVINVTKIIPPKTEAITTPSPVKVQLAKPVRPAVKQTPKRGANLPLAATSAPTQGKDISTTSTPERRDSNASQAIAENVTVKQEVEDTSAQQSTSGTPLFSGQIKSERDSPPPPGGNKAPPLESTPIIARIKSEPDAGPAAAHCSASTAFSRAETPLLPVTKKEDTGVTVIEINGDSGDDDDDCCVVSATPASDVKPPLIPKTEPVGPPSYPPPAYHTPQSSYSSTPVLASTLSSMAGGASTEKQHSFNWNAPDTKPAIDMLEKSADEIFESLLSSATKKEHSLSDASEYISLDTLGPQHSCDVCNTRFTNISLLDDHIRMTGHTKSLIAPTSSLMPYNPGGTNSILSQLLPVKCLADQVGKLSGMNSGPGFTHQQNVMINIQAYPGGGMVPPQAGYNAYPPGQNVYPPGYQQMPGNSMFGNAPGAMPGQYPGQHYTGGYGQQSSMGYQSPMSKAGFSPGMQQNSYTTPSSPYSTASPLQNMQQAYGQTAPGMMNPPMGQMGPPGSSPGHPYPANSPGGMKPPTSASSGIRIQNVQTFPPGQLAPGGTPNTQIRMAAGASVTGARPRMPGVRGARPSVRPGVQVHGHGQVRAGKGPGPRMPMKRPAPMAGGPGLKRRPDMLLPGKHDNEDCQVMAMQKQREGLPMISSVQGAKDKLNLGSQISITKKTVNKEANAMANVLASRGISIKQKQKSRSPTPERPIPHIPNLGAGVSIKHTSKSSNFSIPEAQVGSNMHTCKICRKMFSNSTSLSTHMAAAHPQRGFKCDECPASYPKSLQLQHHKRVFHNVTGPNRELGLPVVDLSQEENLQRLSSLGIYSFIPLANREQASGCFGIPVISVHNVNNGMTSGLQALGADGLLSLGPLKPLPNT
ncbi:uncharacterized protein LOC134750925 [Cydia strobilella]|uniref:uncharacterized protein LOC134750925 n=1 Tax=Cydia strobilella TaxID=1100964 RepID=UPI003003DBBE